MVDKRKQRIEVVPYDPAWSSHFSDEARRIQGIFKDHLVAIHHIGSTAIPGMPAKPTIDILIVIKSIEIAETLKNEMAQLGYKAWGEYGIPGRRFFVKGEIKRTYHVHAFELGNPEINRHLCFRDYLMAHPSEAKQYANLKIELARKFSHDRRAYAKGKQDLVNKIEAKAIAWARQGRKN